MTKEFHPLANIFPLLPEAELSALAADISEHGLKNRVALYEGKILDGRNRYRACELVGITPECKDYTGDDPLGFVISQNLHRRHLSESQRAMVAGRIANLEIGEAGHGRSSANLQTNTRSQAAEQLKVSERSVNTAKKLQKQGVEELQQAVESGQVSVSAAADVSELPESEQVEIVEKGEKEILQAAKQIRPGLFIPR